MNAVGGWKQEVGLLVLPEATDSITTFCNSRDSRCLLLSVVGGGGGVEYVGIEG